MARLTAEEIERLKLEGQAKRNERQAKREANLAKYKEEEIIFELEALGFKSRMQETLYRLERCYLGSEQMDEKLLREIEFLFLENKTVETKALLFERHFFAYEDLIYYTWVLSKELCNQAYRFWNDVLSEPQTSASGSTICRLLSSKPNENLFNMIKDHQDKFFDADYFKRFLQEMVKRNLERGTSNTIPEITWTKEDKILWQRIYNLF